MEKITKIVCLILNILAWAVFVLGLIRLLVAWNTLPDEIGIHFTSDGNFDARRSKLLAFYPYIISLLALAFFGICGFFSNKIKSGLKISSKGDVIIRQQIRLSIYIIQFNVVFFFSGEWADAVIRQRQLNTVIPVLSMYIFMLLLLLLVISIVIVRFTCKKKE